MNQVVAQTQSNAELVETVIAKGDLGKLTPAERNQYYAEMCRSIGLNPLTRPFEYLTLNGKLVLYARRDAADQLRKLNGISVEIVSREVADGLLTVHVRARDASGRTDEDLGVVNVASLKGEQAANAVLKAVTKAKRRVTLSISGLGMLDETEVEDIPALSRVRDGSDGRPKSSRQAKIAGDWEIVKEIAAIGTLEELAEWRASEHVEKIVATFNQTWLDQFEEAVEAKRADLSKPAAKLSTGDSAKLLASMIGMMGRIESRLALKSWAEDAQVRASITTLTEDDRDTLRDAYDTRREALPEL